MPVLHLGVSRPHDVQRKQVQSRKGTQETDYIKMVDAFSPKM